MNIGRQSPLLRRIRINIFYNLYCCAEYVIDKFILNYNSQAVQSVNINGAFPGVLVEND